MKPPVVGTRERMQFRKVQPLNEILAGPESEKIAGTSDNEFSLKL